MEIISVANLRHAALGFIDLDLNFRESPEGLEITWPFSYHPDDAAPLGLLVGQWLADNPGVVIAPYEPPSPLTQDLTKRQVIAAMITGASILDPDAAVTAAIGAIADPVARALALNDWRNAPYYKRDHALFNDADLLAAMGLNSASVDALWALAVQQPT